MDQSIAAPEQKNLRVYWNDKITKTFLEACIQEVTVSGRLGSSLKTYSWANVKEILKKTHNFDVDNKQMRNHAHAKLRNVIERAYGVLKARFPILKQMAPYVFSTQRDIVIACFAVHNFIRMQKLEDQLFEQCDRSG